MAASDPTSGFLLDPPRRAASVAERGTGAAIGRSMLLVVLCQLADLITFDLAVQLHGSGGELGPLGFVYHLGGFWAVAAVKLGLIAVVLTVLARYPWGSERVQRNLAVAVAAIGIAGACTNVLALRVITLL